MAPCSVLCVLLIVESLFRFRTVVVPLEQCLEGRCVYVEVPDLT
jgi:hypothetical protein